MRLLVCGGHRFDDVKWLYAVLDQLHVEESISCIITGAAPGADTLAMCWAKDHGVAYEGYAADWSRYGRSAGPRRNQYMLDHAKPQYVLAFPGGAGTSDMVARAQRVGVAVCMALDLGLGELFGNRNRGVSMIKPTIGRKVWFHPGPGDSLYDPADAVTYLGQPFDATVVYVWNDRLVNLTVASHNGDTYGRSSVILVQPGEAPPTGKSWCEWMPYQVGQSQAVKQAQAEVPQQAAPGGAAA